LQYLIWESWVSNYLALSKKHQQFIQDLANILLTDKYAKNIEENKRNHSRNYDIVSSWKKDMKSSSLWLLLKTYTSFLRDIEEIRSWVGKWYTQILNKINKYKEKRWFNPDSKLYDLLETLKLEVEWVELVHKFLDEKWLVQEMDFRKREKAILYEIERIKAEIKWQETKIKWQEEEIKKLDNYLKVLNRFLDNI
jgi:hypothetical protein